MKKLLSLILALTMISSCLALVGCIIIPPQQTTTIPQPTTVPMPKEWENIVWEDKKPHELREDLKFIPGRLLVNMDTAISEPGKTYEKEFFGGVEIEKIVDISIKNSSGLSEYRNQYVVFLSEKTEEATIVALRIIEQITGVYSVSPDYTGILIPETVANDPYYSYSDDVVDQWALDKIDVPLVWNFTTGTSEVRVGVVDTGIASHPDLDENYDISDALDFYDTSTTNPTLGKIDTNSHGTHVAGIIGAVGNNAIGISGVNWDVSLVQLRSIYASNSLVAIVNAINWATSLWDTEDRISILNFSVGIDGNVEDIERVIRGYCEKGGLFVCSTGNEEQNNDLNGQHHYPSFYASGLYSNPIDNIITVGRSDINDQRPYGANWGAQTIMIYAPGQNIISTIPHNKCSDVICLSTGHTSYGYHLMSGSSMAAPYVAGVAALILSANPKLTAEQLKNCILSGADTIEITVGGGTKQEVNRLNAWGSFMYMMQNYTPEIVVSQGAKQITLNTDRSSSYYLEKKPTSEIIIPFTEEFTFTLSGVGSSVDVILYDSEMNVIPITKTWQNNQWNVTFTKELSAGTYYVSGSYNNTTGGNSLNLSVSHEHTYSDYEYYSPTLHIESCECGAFGVIKSAHVVKKNTVVNNIGLCLLCDEWVNFDDGFSQIIHTITKYSANGSYILPSGVIVLVDEDVEAYFNGTLVFCEKDKLPVTQ